MSDAVVPDNIENKIDASTFADADIAPFKTQWKIWFSIGINQDIFAGTEEIATIWNIKTFWENYLNIPSPKCFRMYFKMFFFVTGVLPRRTPSSLALAGSWEIYVSNEDVDFILEDLLSNVLTLSGIDARGVSVHRDYEEYFSIRVWEHIKTDKMEEIIKLRYQTTPVFHVCFDCDI
jgi:hypothetical protein